jgi:type 1 glutamine amidotransferase
MTNYACESAPKIKALIITGGKEIEHEAFFAMFQSFDNLEFREVRQPEANFTYASHMTDSVDVIIFYDMVQDISAQHKKDFISLLHRGQSMLFLHHSLASYQNWNEFKNIIGGKFYLKDSSAAHSESTYRHDVNFKIQMVNKNHPITKGISDFLIHDEVYDNVDVLPKVYPLLTTQHEESSDVIGWLNRYGSSFTMYIQPGHNHHAFENENYRKLVHQAIIWLANPSM